ncbi:MAG: DUF262 domain-containing protein [Bacteroidales bacterium]|jgi:hypothetical protein|nr:DUF262 domain-containing protein [Bacteroidales bacterium]
MNDIYSFYQLISKYQIEIPIIQRDYAQGRNNSKAADVRKSLVDNMIKAVKEDKPLFFDFVYGRVDNNKFIPFDGQQRLTTLFLFHKYVFEKCQSDSGCNHKDNCSCGGILGRFSYATRQSSREFCEKLVQEKIISGNSLTDNIKNQSWFYPDWEKDPTVMGMLTMLDEIHCQMRNETDFKTFAEKLTSGCNCPITFHFVDMGEHKMSDETYVKMNARGKTLTPFENFKASLEQYLEEKSKTDLLNRWKGNYDEPKQIYTGIDGIWLDLFWKVAKQGKEGAKELPDTLIMSFFNRHFMNVWRCCYANNSKSEKKEEYDTFNTRIQKEMPLYPTKDNFVPFDIYEYVIDKCGVDVCLSPIFNIWDALCEKDNSILSDCQAVWNRKEESPKWNLYQGDKNNNNRETYPSRVAFYALMKYFSTQKDTPKLSQWMRVVWNIIENSTIDSSEPYHTALRLIEKLSAKSHTIYNALANEFESFELGNQYHAQEQVAEEIAKAKQILNGGQRTDGKTWEEIIIEAERYAFFKGAIRFLFTQKDIGDDWDDFDTKWNNAQKYFDENGVKNDIKVLLTKSLVIQCNNWNKQLYDKQIFNPNARTWKWILTVRTWIVPIHNILRASNINDIGATNEKNDENVKKFITPIIKDLPFDYFINNEPNGRFRWLGPRLCFYKPHGRDMATLDWENWHRNKILSSLLGSITTGTRMGDSNFFWGRDINFKYKDYFFQWYGNPNENELDVYLMENDWEYYKKRPNPTSDKGTDEDIYYCFRVTPDMESNTSLFIEELDRLIDEAFSK